MLSETSAILYIGLLYLLSFPLGYVILLWAKLKSFLNLPFFIKLPLILALGLTTLTVLLFIAGFVVINGALFFATTIISLVFYIYHHNIRFNYESIHWSKVISLENILPATLFLGVFLHFSTVISIFGWPPPGDIFWHGLYTSTLLYNQKITFNMSPYDASLPSAPPLMGFTGLHILSANFSSLTGLLPGEAVFIVGGAIAILIPMLLYISTYLLTNSKLISLFTFFSAFSVGSDLTQWVFGYFYNGPYQSLFGFLASLLFIIYPIVTNMIKIGNTDTWRNNILLFLIILTIFIIYPPFVTFPLLYVLISMIYTGKLHKILDNVEKQRKLLLGIVLLATASLFVVMTLVLANPTLFSEFMRGIILRVYGLRVYRAGNAMQNSVFYTPIGIATILAGGTSVFFIVKRIYIELSIFYIVIFIPLMLSLIPALFPFFSFILPSRSFIVCSLISWIILAILLNHFSSHLKLVSIIFKLFNRRFLMHLSLSNVLAVLLIFLVFTPSVVSNFSLEQANKYSWFTRCGFINDYDVLLWAKDNIKPDELILDDFSFTGFYLQSFSVKNTTSLLWSLSDFKIQRAIEALNVLRHIYDESILLNFIDKYHVKYILVTSEWGQYIWEGIGGDNRYVAKPFSPEEYKSILGNYTFLKLVFEKGNAGIYRVLPHSVEQRVALQLNGTGYIRVEHDDSLMPIKGLTLSIWINPDQLPNIDTFFISKKYNGYELSWRWNKKFALLLNHSIVLESNKVFSVRDLGKWWNIIMVYDGVTAYIYINGELDSSTNVHVTIPFNKDPLYIGCRYSGNAFGFPPPSLVRDVRIYNRPLSAEEVRLLYNGTNIVDGLVLYLPLNEGNGTVAHDSSGYNHNGVICGAQWAKYLVVIVGE